MNIQAMIQRIFSLLAEKGISKMQFYKDVHITSGALTQWKNGVTHPSQKTLLTIAEYLGVTYEWLVAGSAQKEKPVEKDGPEAGLNMELSEDERAILDLLRQVPDEDLPAARRAIKAMLAGMRDGE